MVTQAEHNAATKRMQQMRRTIPYAVEARYDKRLNRIFIALNTGIEIVFPPAQLQFLETAKASDLSEIEISPSGYGVYFPKIDDGLYLPTLLQGIFGTKHWMEEKSVARRTKPTKSSAKRATSKTAA